ncbi:MAG TPA: helicase-related protein [Acidimicrobiia bacterium]|nr:helicase-related protein [Acidimicrobiia bacterium]
MQLFVTHDDGRLSEHNVADPTAVECLTEDGNGDPAAVLGALWSQWMRRAAISGKASALGGTPLDPYPHQNLAVYGAMLPQPVLRFLLADEPGTGKTIMGGLWLREMQRLGFVNRALVVCPAHLVTKWQEDFERFLGGPDSLRRITADTVREHAVGVGHDMWVVSLELAGMNQSVLEAIDPDRAGWDAVVFDEAHRMTPTAGQWHRVGLTIARKTPRVVLMTATPHRGNEWLFRALMHLVDPSVYPAVERVDDKQPGRALQPGPLHFLRRMKEELVDYDGQTRLFKSRRAHNFNVALNLAEQAFYTEALDLVDQFFPASSSGLAKMVYGKRAASCLHSLAETLTRRRDGMATLKPTSPEGTVQGDPWDADDAEQDENEVIHAGSVASREEKKAIGDLLTRLDAHVGDNAQTISKWPRLVDDCLAANGIVAGNSEQAVVFTEFADTADWLVARFQSNKFSAKRYSGRDPHPVRDQVRAEFASRHFQILVSTDAGNEGIDLQTAHVLVNWDIPWSLVRLEQRMGRIHRVGQTRDVELYNLVATGTREGDAHLRLLDNLCAAANELGGKMFDSLSLVAEIALSEAGTADIEKLLAKTYASGTGGDLATQAVQSITKDRLRQIRDLTRRAEDQLASGVELSKAISSLHDERLERINPHIVERFLRRIARAGLVTLERSAVADEGLWYLSTSAMTLPPDFRSGRTLIATSGAAKRDAVNAGAAAAGRALMLGPGEPAFTVLTATAADALRAALYQGGRLHDPNSVTDYDLFVFEVPVTEGGGRRNTSWSYLIRVDQTGARAVTWEALANLEPGERASKTPHPARSTNAETAAQVALTKDLNTRKDALTTWLAQARTQLQQLPSDLTDHIEGHDERVAARAAIEEAVSGRIKELDGAITLTHADLERVGWAHVRGTGVPLDPKEQDSETIAMAHVVQFLSDDGWGVADRHTEKDLGFDLHATRGREQRCVEVKGVWDSASSTGIRMTGQEIAKAGLLGNDYWLYVVDQCNDGNGTLFHAWRHPAVVFADAAQDVAIVRIPGSALSAAREVVPA